MAESSQGIGLGTSITQASSLISQGFQKNSPDIGITPVVLQRVDEFIQRVGRLSNFQFYEVTYLNDLNTLQVPAPAVAFVREIGDFYLRHAPQYWFGTSSEPQRWVRLQYSGSANSFRATRIEYIRSKATALLGQLIANGVKYYNENKYTELSRGGFWKVAKDLWYLAHNYHCIELNDLTCGTEGDQLYTFHDGDIVVESGARAWCVQTNTKLPLTTKTYFDRPVRYIGQLPLIHGTPGIHVQKAKEVRDLIYETHPERIGYVVPTHDVEKGSQSFTAVIHPDSLPRLVQGGGKPWIEATEQSGGGPNPGIRAPRKDEYPDRDWNLRKFVWLQTPDPYVELKVTGWTPPTAGVMPNCLNASLTLEQPCPIPLIAGGSVYTKTTETYYLNPASRNFGWMPRGIYGGQYNESTIQIRVRGRGPEDIDIGADQQGPRIGQNTIKPYWAWINPIGKRRFSRLRGIIEDDFVSVSNWNYLYPIARVQKNPLDNPLYVHLASPLQADVGGGSQNLDGVWIGHNKLHWVIGELPPNPYASFYGWPAPDGTTGVPLVVQNMNYNRVHLVAPVAKTIPAGTRLPIWVSTDLDTVTYAYHDFYEFMFNLEQYVEFRENITREAVVAKIAEFQQIQKQVSAALGVATANASVFWFTHPFYVNRRVDDWLPDEYKIYGNTFIEVSSTLTKIVSDLSKLLEIKPPDYNNVEFISLLRYSHRSIPGG